MDVTFEPELLLPLGDQRSHFLGTVSSVVFDTAVALAELVYMAVRVTAVVHLLSHVVVHSALGVVIDFARGPALKCTVGYEVVEIGLRSEEVVCGNEVA